MITLEDRIFVAGHRGMQEVQSAVPTTRRLSKHLTATRQKLI